MRNLGAKQGLMAGFAALCLSLGSSPAVAEASARDLQVISRALGFIEPAPSGTLDLGIAYPTPSAAGRAEAERVAAAMAGGMRAGNLILRPRLVTVEEASAAPVIAILLTDAALPQAGHLAAALAGLGIPIIATDPAAVASGFVVMAIRTEPRVEILVSRAAARAANVGFSAAFRMMVQER